jgi:hypothetical protein
VSWTLRSAAPTVGVLPFRRRDTGDPTTAPVPATTLEDLAARVAALETEVARLHDLTAALWGLPNVVVDVDQVVGPDY